MYKLKNLEITPRNGYTVTNIPENFKMDKLTDYLVNEIMSARYRSDPYCLCLKPDSQFIPIINVFSSNISKKSDVGTEETLKRKLEANVTPLLKCYYKGNVEDLLNKLNSPISEIYNMIVEETDSSFTPSIPIRGGRNNSIAMRVSDLQQILDSNQSSRIFTSYKRENNLLIYPFYFVSNDIIILSMMIKKEYISQFRTNWCRSEVDPNHVEIWVNKSYIENNDKTSFNKWIREIFLMKLTMQGFTIRVKDDINSEVINIPRIKIPSTIEGMNNLKKTISKMML